MDNVYLRVNTCVRLRKESFVSDVCIDLKKRQKEFIIDLNCCIHRSDVSRIHYADVNGTTYYCIVKKNDYDKPIELVYERTGRSVNQTAHVVFFETRPRIWK